MQSNKLLIDTNLFFINQGVDLLKTIGDEDYSVNTGPYNKSGVGRHFRHIIEHYYSFLSYGDSLIDYDDRKRDIKLETDRSFMITSMENVAGEMQAFGDLPHDPDLKIKVRSNEGGDSSEPQLSYSSLARELQFLISHTVHHYALIGLILKSMGMKINEDFGVAPSTLKFEREQLKEVKAS